jgi:hypothetical protein
MESALITKSSLTDKKHSLFAVFDGHEGNILFIYFQVLRCQSLLRDILFNNYKRTLTIRKETMSWP